VEKADMDTDAGLRDDEEDAELEALLQVAAAAT